jgi:hypothetical protein
MLLVGLDRDLVLAFPFGLQPWTIAFEAFVKKSSPFPKLNHPENGVIASIMRLGEP